LTCGLERAIGTHPMAAYCHRVIGRFLLAAPLSASIQPVAPHIDHQFCEEIEHEKPHHQLHCLLVRERTSVWLPEAIHLEPEFFLYVLGPFYVGAVKLPDVYSDNPLNTRPITSNVTFASIVACLCRIPAVIAVEKATKIWKLVRDRDS
jgi:hypothetical protein